MMRRLDLHPAKKLRNPNRHLRSLRKWADSFKDFQWDDYRRFSDERFVQWRIPIHSKLTNKPHTTRAIQAEVIQCLVNAATNLQAALPEECSQMRVATLIDFPSLFNSEVTLFISPDYYETFNPAQAITYTPLDVRQETEIARSETDIINEFGIVLPIGSIAGGYIVRCNDFESPEYSYEYESWVVAMPKQPQPARLPHS